MKKYLFILLFTPLLIACANKSLQLPQVAVSGVSNIQNHTEIWVFYKFDDQKVQADINKNNTISTTHWIINIDKRLPMDEVIPVLQMVKAKRAKKTIHSVDGVHDYLSYSDILDKKIALFQIDGIQYLTLTNAEIKTVEKEKPCNYTLIFSNDYFMINSKRYARSEWSQSLFTSMQKSCIQLQLDANLNYQNYMKYRLELNTFLPKSSTVEATEYLLNNK